MTKFLFLFSLRSIGNGSEGAIENTQRKERKGRVKLDKIAQRTKDVMEE